MAHKAVSGAGWPVLTCSVGLPEMGQEGQLLHFFPSAIPSLFSSLFLQNYVRSFPNAWLTQRA